MKHRKKAAARPTGARRPSRIPAGKPGELFEALVAVQARLLAPGGCPWDREQTHDTLRPYLLEEAYEVLDALDLGDDEHIAEELGDLLLQVVFHANLAARGGRFDIGDVIRHIRDKLVRRHPHVFGDVKAETSGEVLENWERLKREEKRARKGKSGGASDQTARSALEGVPRTLPALLEGQQLSKKASKVGFDWKTAPEILDKLAEEADELRGALDSSDRARKEDELGDLLFVCVNLARFMGLDAEIALKRANRKFSRRFREMERMAGERGLQLADLGSERLERLWVEAKEETA